MSSTLAPRAEVGRRGETERLEDKPTAPEHAFCIQHTREHVPGLERVGEAKKRGENACVKRRENACVRGHGGRARLEEQGWKRKVLRATPLSGLDWWSALRRTCVLRKGVNGCEGCEGPSGEDVGPLHLFVTLEVDLKLGQARSNASERPCGALERCIVVCSSHRDRTALVPHFG
eukprot:935819-Pleurochrysis_carterae.AAC.1